MHNLKNLLRLILILKTKQNQALPNFILTTLKVWGLIYYFIYLEIIQSNSLAKLTMLT